ncbi:MAG: hypothetical protein SHS37scaffold537_19 [Phage 68_12]|nr:MAG: hypothetical protein SHS37scaffold537_19 [Phage 68_12]
MGVLDAPTYSRRQADALSPGMVGFAEQRNTSSVAGSPSAGVNLPGLCLVVPPTDTPVELFWGATPIIAVAGGGYVALNLYEVGVNGALTLRGTSNIRLEPGTPTTTAGERITGGPTKLVPSTIPRLMALNLGLSRDAGSSLAASIVNSDTDYWRPFLEMVQR